MELHAVYNPNRKGPELRIHAAGCADVKRDLRGATSDVKGEFDSPEDCAEDFYQDFIAEGSMDAGDAIGYSEFLPCATRNNEETEMPAKTATAKTTETKPAATIASADAEAALLNGVRSETKAPAVKRGASAKAKTEKAPAAPKAKAEPKTPQEKMLRPATKTVVGYVEWLKATLGAEAWKTLSADPDRLAQVSLTNYGSYRASK